MIAFFTAAVWLVHPLQTQSVTYIVQRMNSMAAMFYLLSLVCYVQGRTEKNAAKRKLFFAATFLSGLMAVGSKEIAVTLPFFILLYEWFFFQNLSTEFLKTHRLKIAGTVLAGVLIVLFIVGFKPLETILSGYQYRNFTPPQRVLTEFRVVLFYISLLVLPLPSRLNLDHDFPLSHSLIRPPSTLISIAAVIACIGFAIYAAKKNRLLSFAVFWYFGNLVIESSVIPLEIIFEHRTYLPSMLPIALAVMFFVRKLKLSHAVILMLSATFILSFLTYERNNAWHDKITLWKDCAKKSPGKARPHFNLGVALEETGQYDEAIRTYAETLRIDPNHAQAHNNIGLILANRGQFDEAMPHYIEALRIKPDYAKAHNNLGLALSHQKKFAEAVKQYREAVRLSPDYAKAHSNLGVALARLRDMKGAVRQFLKALEIDPDYADAHNNVANMYMMRHQFDDAIRHYLQAIRLKPDDPNPYYNLANAYSAEKKFDPAVEYYTKALKIRPDFKKARVRMNALLQQMGKTGIESHGNE